MISLTEFTPLIQTNIKTFSDLETGYKKAIRDVGLVTPDGILSDWLSSGSLYGVRLNRNTRGVVQKILLDYKRGYLLTRRPKAMAALIARYDKLGFNTLIHSGDKATPFGRALLKAFGYEDRFRSIEKKGLWLASILNIKVCPYCNSQYTMVVRKRDGSSFGKFQFDHFFSKDRYPYLSISLYNLIPSCASCNHKKSNDQVYLNRHFHPYHDDLSSIAEFHVKYPADPSKMSLQQAMKLKVEDIVITFRPRVREVKQYVKVHCDLYDIELMYKRHTDIAHELLVKAILYNQHYQTATLSISNLFPSRKVLLQYILGNNLVNEKINQRPLSKFTIDVARQLRLIR
jgi:hypothetical protein